MNTQQLEAQSEREREDIQETIGQIKQRLSPGQLVDELLAYTKDGGTNFVSNLGRQASENPLAVTLIGAGIAWYLAGPKSGTGANSRPRQMADSETDSGFDAGGAISDGMRQAKDTASSLADKARGAVDTVSDSAASLSSRAADKASAVADSARGTFETAQSMATRSVEFATDQPLVLLGAGLAIGAALGAALPATETEKELMGEASTQVKQSVMETASDQLESAKDAAAELYQDVTQGDNRTQ